MSGTPPNWIAHCVLAPRLKERRYRRQFGQPFIAYQSKVPYVTPKFDRHV